MKYQIVNEYFETKQPWHLSQSSYFPDHFVWITINIPCFHSIMTENFLSLFAENGYCAAITLILIGILVKPWHPCPNGYACYGSFLYPTHPFSIGPFKGHTALAKHLHILYCIQKRNYQHPSEKLYVVGWM